MDGTTKDRLRKIAAEKRKATVLKAQTPECFAATLDYILENEQTLKPLPLAYRTLYMAIRNTGKPDYAALSYARPDQIEMLAASVERRLVRQTIQRGRSIIRTVFPAWVVCQLVQKLQLDPFRYVVCFTREFVEKYEASDSGR